MKRSARNSSVNSVPPPQQATSPWLSSVLMMASYMTYGGFLFQSSASLLVWGVSLGCTAVFAALCTICWKPCRRILIQGFRSDLGYVVLALLTASLAMAAVTRFRLVACLLMLVAATLLTRVDMLIAQFSNRKTWFCMVLLALLGFGLSWGVYRLGTSPLQN